MHIVIQVNSPKSYVNEKFAQLIADSDASGNKFYISYYILYNYHDEVFAL